MVNKVSSIRQVKPCTELVLYACIFAYSCYGLQPAIKLLCKYSCFLAGTCCCVHCTVQLVAACRVVSNVALSTVIIQTATVLS